MDIVMGMEKIWKKMGGECRVQKEKGGSSAEG
ncbi:hypothetical protein A2U01_0036986, partial [Trifolium medium]|nr:hypothetical protein [Trifolium medium]